VARTLEPKIEPMINAQISGVILKSPPKFHTLSILYRFNCTI